MEAYQTSNVCAIPGEQNLVPVDRLEKIQAVPVADPGESITATIEDHQLLDLDGSLAAAGRDYWLSPAGQAQLAAERRAQVFDFYRRRQAAPLGSGVISHRHAKAEIVWRETRQDLEAVDQTTGEVFTRTVPRNIPESKNLDETELAEQLQQRAAEHLEQPGRKWTAQVGIFPGGLLIGQGHGQGPAEVPDGRPVRSTICEFSAKSRRRLMRQLMAVQWPDLAAPGKRSRSGRALFLSLTYSDLSAPWCGVVTGSSVEGSAPDLDDGLDPVADPGRAVIAWHGSELTGATVHYCRPGRRDDDQPQPRGYVLDRAKIKRDLDTLGKRIKRAWPEYAGLLWKMEIEDRKSGARLGELIPHFHALVTFSEPVRLARFRVWLAAAWWAITHGVRTADPLAWYHARILAAAGTNRQISPGTRLALLTILDPHAWVHGTNCQIVYGTGGRLMSYLGKYLGKGFAWQNVAAGRVWAVQGELVQTSGDWRTIDNPKQYRQLMRAIRSFGRCSRYLANVQDDATGLAVYCFGPSWSNLVDSLAMDRAADPQCKAPPPVTGPDFQQDLFLPVQEWVLIFAQGQEHLELQEQPRSAAASGRIVNDRMEVNL